MEILIIKISGEIDQDALDSILECVSSKKSTENEFGILWSELEEKKEEDDPDKEIARLIMLALKEIKNDQKKKSLFRNDFIGEKVLVGDVTEAVNVICSDQGGGPISPQKVGRVLRNMGFETSKRISRGYPLIWDDWISQKWLEIFQIDDQDPEEHEQEQP